MTVSTIRAGFDTYVASTRPNTPYHRAPNLRVAQNLLESYIRLKNPAPRGATVITATVCLTQATGYTGTRSFTLARSADDVDVNTKWTGRPGTTGAGATLTKTDSPAGTVWEFPVTAIYQAFVDGTVNRGFKLTAGQAAETRFYGLDATQGRPFLRLEWGYAPQQPQNLIPSFAATSLQRWVQACDYVDRSGADDIQSVQVQIDPDGDWTGANHWDSGEQAVETPALDLSQAWTGATLNGVATPTYPGLADGASTKVRMRVRDNTGIWSAYSKAVTVKRVTKAALNILAPGTAPNNKVYEFTPPINWSFGGTQTHYRVVIRKTSDPKTNLHDSGKIKGNANSYTIPARVLADETTYTVIVQVWDNVVRERSTGDPVYIEATRDFTVDYDTTPAAPSGLTADNAGTRPWVDVTITRSSSPDGWTLQRSDDNGATWRAIATDIEPADVQVTSTTWRIRDWTARPGLPYRYRARAHVNGKLTGFAETTITPKSECIWLLDPNRPALTQMPLGGKTFETTSVDNAAVYVIQGALEVVRAVVGLTGLSGTAEKLLIRDRPEYGLTWKQIEDRLYNLKERPTDEFRIVIGDLNIPVALGDIVIQPHPDSRGDQVLKLVSFSFWQTGEHSYTVGV